MLASMQLGSPLHSLFAEHFPERSGQPSSLISSAGSVGHDNYWTRENVTDEPREIELNRPHLAINRLQKLMIYLE